MGQGQPEPEQQAPQAPQAPQAQQDQGPPGRIGLMNGKWSFLLKAVLISTPAAWAIFITVDLPWRVWVTRSTFQALEHDARANDCMERIDEFMRDHRNEYKDLERRVDRLPPDYRDRVERLEIYERENKADHTNILISLEAIKAQLGIHRIRDGQPPDGARVPPQPGASHATAAVDDNRGGDIAADKSSG